MFENMVYVDSRKKEIIHGNRYSLSVIIPVYNVAPYLDRCLSSCINQTLQNIEIIVVNDESTDCSLSILNRYAARDPRFVVVNKRNEGLIYARKSGIEQASGEFLFFLDGDDYLPPDALEILYHEAIATGAEVTVGDWIEDKEQNRRIYKSVSIKDGMPGWAFIEKIRPGYAYLTLWGKLFRRHLFDDLLYERVDNGEDIYMLFQVLVKVPVIHKVNKPVYHYVMRPGSVSRCGDDIQVRYGLLLGRALCRLNERIDVPGFALENNLMILAGGMICHCSIQDYRSVRAFLKKEIWKNKVHMRYLFCYYPKLYGKMLCFRIAPVLYVGLRKLKRMIR